MNTFSDVLRSVLTLMAVLGVTLCHTHVCASPAAPASPAAAPGVDGTVEEPLGAHGLAA